MILAAVPIAMPINRVLGEDVIMSRSDVSNGPMPATGSELRGPIAAPALHLSESIGLNRSIVLETSNTIAGTFAERSGRKLALNNRSVSAGHNVTLRKLRGRH
jgi:hypothetical protein